LTTSAAYRPETEEWLASVRERYDVGPDGEMLLAQAAQTLDRIAECEAVIEEDGLMLPTRGGGSRVHPAARLPNGQQVAVPSLHAGARAGRGGVMKLKRNRRVPPAERELEWDELMELLVGVGRIRGEEVSAFGSEDERRAAWEAHRDEIVAMSANGETFGTERYGG
jgi:hypothetical protein